MSQLQLAEATGFPQSYISRWELSRLPKPDDLWILEVVGLSVTPGTVYRMAGFTDEVLGVEQAVKADHLLTALGRRACLAVYEACRIGD